MRSLGVDDATQVVVLSPHPDPSPSPKPDPDPDPNPNPNHDPNPNQAGELKELLAFDPSKTALGRKENSKIITDAELKLVLDRTKGPVVGKGFRAVEKVTNSFDAMAQAANAADK